MQIEEVTEYSFSYEEDEREILGKAADILGKTYDEMKKRECSYLDFGDPDCSEVVSLDEMDKAIHTLMYASKGHTIY